MLILHEFVSKTIGSLVYMPNYSGKKTWSLIHGLSFFFGLMTPPELGVSNNIGQNFAEMLQFEDLAVFLFYYMHIFREKILS